MLRILVLVWVSCLLPFAEAQARSTRWFDLRPIEIPAAELPVEATETLVRIRAGGPFRYQKDGAVFGNRERILPPRARGYYTEYTVRTPGARDRGARRIVAGDPPATSGEYYYTDDHYRSFRRIRE